MVSGIQKDDLEPSGSLIFHHLPPYLPLPLSFLVPDETPPVHAPQQSSRFISPQPITSTSLIVGAVVPSLWSPVCLCSCWACHHQTQQSLQGPLIWSLWLLLVPSWPPTHTLGKWSLYQVNSGTLLCRSSSAAGSSLWRAPGVALSGAHHLASVLPESRPCPTPSPASLVQSQRCVRRTVLSLHRGFLSENPAHYPTSWLPGRLRHVFLTSVAVAFSKVISLISLGWLITHSSVGLLWLVSFILFTTLNCIFSFANLSPRMS